MIHIREKKRDLKKKPFTLKLHFTLTFKCNNIIVCHLVKSLDYQTLNWLS